MALPFFGMTSLVAQTVKCLPTVRETHVQSLSREDLLEKEMATQVFFPEKSYGQRSLLDSVGHKESDTTERLHFFFTFSLGLE